MKTSWMTRALALCLALCLMCGGAIAEGTENMEQHFVPENPDMTKDAVDVDLGARVAVYGQPIGETTDEGVRYAGGETKKTRIPLPFRMRQGDVVTVTVTGRFDSEEDKALTVTLSNESNGRCSTEAGTIGRVDGVVFTATVDLTAFREADSLMLSSESATGAFQDVTIMGITVLSDAMNAPTSMSYAESVQQEWYQRLLEKSVLNVGSNVRVKELIARAQAGENVTVATIGGSITEGAGARRYQECYAYQIYEGFKRRYGAGDGSNVSFVNAGVGGTPSTFGWMRWQREIVDRVKDDDGLPDLVVIEYAVNDGGEPTNHQCYESMVRQILAQPNRPVVILLFAVFPSGYTLQHDIAPIGYAADLMMISIKNGAFPYVGDKWTEEGFFYDVYHPTTLGHKVMADCVLHGIEKAAAGEGSDQDIDLTAPAAYGTAFIGMERIFRDQDNSGIALALGSFDGDDAAAYKNQPVGRVCGKNFFHTGKGSEPMTFRASFKNMLVAYRTVSDSHYGKAEVYIDGERVAILNANTGSWGQSVVDLVWYKAEAAEHTVEIRMAEGQEDKKFTITAISYTP